MKQQLRECSAAVHAGKPAPAPDPLRSPRCGVAVINNTTCGPGVLTLFIGSAPCNNEASSLPERLAAFSRRLLGAGGNACGTALWLLPPALSLFGFSPRTPRTLWHVMAVFRSLVDGEEGESWNGLGWKGP